VLVDSVGLSLAAGDPSSPPPQPASAKARTAGTATKEPVRTARDARARRESRPKDME
jgi:hypothetical protein